MLLLHISLNNKKRKRNKLQREIWSLLSWTCQYKMPVEYPFKDVQKVEESVYLKYWGRTCL